MSRWGKELEDDPNYQARLADGRLHAPTDDIELTYTTAGRNAAYLFLVGVGAIVVFGLFPDLRPTLEGEPISVTTIIQLIMSTVAALILLISKPEVKTIPDSSVFRAGMVSAIALFGLAWLTDTFIGAWETEIVNVVGDWVTSWSFVFFFGVFLVAALTTSQSTATRTIVTIGLAAVMSTAVIAGMLACALDGVFTLPTNCSQIAAANFDETGTTKLGNKLVDHSFIMPVILLGISTAVTGAVLGTIFY
jgi:anaerobic C4-dicarboxylate transporter DcuA/anaerobic C4-dicarboxylate transporter DcuB